MIILIMIIMIVVAIIYRGSAYSLKVYPGFNKKMTLRLKIGTIKT